MASDPILHLFTTAEYHTMADAGVFAEGDRLELIEGEIYQMPPVGHRHAAQVKRLLSVLGDAFRGRAILGVQDPVQLDDFSEPQPDLAVLRRKDDFYLDHHPRPEDIFLVVEVADSTLEFDRRRKLPPYARSGIPEVWIANLVDGLLEFYRDPAPHGYRQVLRLSREDRIAPVAFSDVELLVGDLLG